MRVRRLVNPSRSDFYLIIAFLVGIVLLGAASFVRTVPQVYGVFLGLGTASVTAAILGLAIDRFLKRDLARDAVEVALGYLLPEDIKEEMRWIYHQQFLCREHVQTHHLLLNDDGETITMKVTIQRRLVNLTDEVQPLDIGLAVDEWGFRAGPSKITRVAYRLENRQWQEMDTDKAAYESGVLEVKPIEVPIPRGAAVELEFIYQETKRINDVHHSVFAKPTRHPRVIVSADEQLEHYVRFGHRKQAEMTPNPEGGSYRLSGTLLPQQSVEVRWWKKADDGEMRDSVSS